MAAVQQPYSPVRPRPKSRVMSWGSGGRESESGSRPKVDLTESPRDKARSRMSITTKADPSRAITEQQPGQAAFDQTTRESLRSMQHKDAYGNVITDPDRSNPTRSRMERPLDTIRSFEAAVDGGSSRRHPPRPETAEPNGFASRRSSYHQSYGPMQSRYQDDGYEPRASYGARNGYASHPAVNGAYGYGSNSPTPMSIPRRMPPRRTDQDAYGGQGNGYYDNGHYQQSYDAATTGSGSGQSYGTEPWGNSTDPSSQNSSFDRLHQALPPAPKADLGEQYGYSGYGASSELQQRPIMEDQPYDDYGQPGGYDQRNYSQHGYPQQYHSQAPPVQVNGHDQPNSDGGGPPPPPPHSAKPSIPRAPSKLQSARRPTTSSPPQQYDAYGAPFSPEGGDKRKSWLKRRFSKNGN